MRFGRHLFCSSAIWLKRFLSGHRIPDLKKPEWALIAVLDLIIARMGLGHFAGFSKIARIRKPGILSGFRGWYSLFWYGSLRRLNDGL